VEEYGGTYVLLAYDRIQAQGHRTPGGARPANQRQRTEKVFVQLPMPEDHSRDYERVIEMLEWSQDETLELDESEFSTYVLDQWGWQEGFAQTYAMYSGS
jgi:hypothetical protein